MTTERELLELAAKAAGVYGQYETGVIWYKNPFGDDAGFNPLNNDGDALRLAVKLGLKVLIDLDEGATRIHNDYDGLICMHMHFDEGPEVATRRAIVRAAAEIGRSMK